ncbi:MAG TPA: hypothetical protein VE978_17255 [Chitinophagales bacterium]|nr:hypothetical protein [Chitinophagales bacterium]
MKRTALFLTLLIALLKFTQAQPSLGIFSNSISVTPSTVDFNDTVSISFSVVNTGNQSFFGQISIYYSVNNNYQEVLDSFTNNVQIDSGQLIQIIDTTHVINPPQYAVGDNIVVIWPVAQNGNVLTTDSGVTHIFVDTLLGIGSPVIKEQIKVFYRSTDQFLFIDYGELLSQIKDVTAYSILGEQIIKYNYAVNEISFAENSQQIFLLKIRTKGGEAISFKILRM